jgi:RND superfamily putative drug exporter
MPAGSLASTGFPSVEGMRTPQKLAIWSARHRVIAIAGWLLFVVLITLLAGQLGTSKAGRSEQGTGESRRGEEIIAAAGFPNHAGELVLVRSDRLTVTDPAFRAAVTDTIAAIEATGQVESIRSPLAAGGAGQISADRHSALVAFDIRGARDTAKDRIGPVLDAVATVQRGHPELYVAEMGDASAEKVVGEQLQQGLSRLSMLSIPLSLGILLVAFGAVVAALLPVGLAVTGILAAFGLLAVASRVTHTVDATADVMLLVGLAVGVDYCLFYIRREREERARGADPRRALEVAAWTSGRSVLVSGLTVMVAMAGMFLTRDVTFASFAMGTILVVATAVAGSLTVLPALLASLGDRVDFGRIPGLYRRQGTGRVWRAVLAAVLRRPLVSAVLAAAALGALAAPVLHLHTRSPGVEDFGTDLPVVQAYQHIQRAFPGGADPAHVVVKAPDVTAPGVTSAIAALRERAVATGQLHEPVTVTVNPDHTVAVVSIGLSGTGTDAVSDRALDVLRTRLIPATVGALPGTEVAVTGQTAAQHDFTAGLRRSLPLVFAFVLGLAFLLMLVSFRSLVVALTTIGLNLLSVAAAYGLLVLVFQDGHGAGALGVAATGGITNWLPMFLFVILFGLSMDYHVFVLSRIREGYDRGMSTKDAIHTGIARTAGVITSAAVVMVAVFALFITMPLVSLKEMGVGLAAAVLLDATVVRAVLLPAVMALLGDRNWYLPRWLGWLPRTAPADQPGPVPRPRPEPQPEPVLT